MISLILYGRNDAHGYNLHRRAALSLNCLAEVLADPDDELVFVDYNTPDELPTFVEAIADTLTGAASIAFESSESRRRVHHRRYGSLTHLPVLEPVARNTAVRRTNPANRWLLSTNTDMVLVPPPDESLSDLCADLPDALYGLPRFELPEWLWENLPRTKPEQSIAELRHLGPRLRLDEHTLSYEDIRFDAPGDFQLCLREDVFAIHGFDERMLLGWHVDSNLAKRLTLHRGSIETIDRLAGYHCNHSRIPTVYQATAGSRTTSTASSSTWRSPRFLRNRRAGGSSTTRSRRSRSTGESVAHSPIRSLQRSPHPTRRPSSRLRTGRSG